MSLGCDVEVSKQRGNLLALILALLSAPENTQKVVKVFSLLLLLLLFLSLSRLLILFRCFTVWAAETRQQRQEEICLNNNHRIKRSPSGHGNNKCGGKDACRVERSSAAVQAVPVGRNDEWKKRSMTLQLFEVFFFIQTCCWMFQKTKKIGLWLWSIGRSSDEASQSAFQSAAAGAVNDNGRLIGSSGIIRTTPHPRALKRLKI